MTQFTIAEAKPETIDRSSQTKVAPSRLAPAVIGGTTMIVPRGERDHPAKALLVERAYHEFCRRHDQGDNLDPDQFCDGFPSVRSALIKLVQCHQFFADDPATAGEEHIPVIWPEVGETFLDFELLQELGSGAFGRVFLAAEPKLGNRLVAVKVAKDFGLAEAKLLGRLKHRNIVPVYSVQFDVVTGLSAVCMPYVGSTTLDDVLDHVYSQSKPRAHHVLEAARDLKHPLETNGEQGAVDPFLQSGAYVDAVRSLGAQLADALAFIHGLGIYHRDLKPSNVLVSPQGVPMLLDFNLSTAAKDVNGLFGGTLPFMSPEQLQAADPDGHAAPGLLDGRSDIFSFGVILFQMLTGEHPYGPVSLKVHPRELRQQLLQRHFEGAPSPRLFNRDIDPAFSRLIERCLAYNPNDRPQSAAEIAEALRRDLTPKRRAQRWISRRPRTMVASLLLCLTIGLVGAAAATVYRPRPEQPMDAGVRLFEDHDYVGAIREFNKATAADPKDAAALFARARTYQQLGGSNPASKEMYWPLAIEDLYAVEKLNPDARHTAAIGYGVLQIDKYVEGARQRFQSAVDGGFARAEVYNNLGYCLERQSKFDEAERNLDRAIELDPHFQAAYFNRADLHFRCVVPLRTMPSKKIDDVVRAKIAKRLEAGINDIKKAIDIGPVHADLYELAARLHAEAAGQNRDSAKDEAYLDLSKAVRQGLAVTRFTSDRTFTRLFGEKQIKSLCQDAETRQPAAPFSRYLDPLKGRVR